MGWKWIYFKLPPTVILTVQKPYFFINKIAFAIKPFAVLLYQKNPAPTV